MSEVIDYPEGEWQTCWHCQGEGGWHDCGNDCCPCLDKESIDEICRECKGEGEYLVPFESETEGSDS